MGIASHKLSEKVWKNQFRDVDDSEIEAKISEEWASLIEKCADVLPMVEMDLWVQ